MMMRSADHVLIVGVSKVITSQQERSNIAIGMGEYCLHQPNLFGTIITVW